MMLKIENVLLANGVVNLRAIIDGGDWIDGNETSGHQSRTVKRNRQLRQGSDTAHEAGRLVLEAALQATTYFPVVSIHLPT